ncbi:hypothetical protein [Flavobacterium cerinum]|uniref:Uncharacterized protein n=1 Tax=Flavobacterium cerinum TaxID=2502784 RepID=A0A444HE84_9FLAO|nr:hypothetical protein [Flavobacterium cerinum]RWX02487.1 hypothetical protein EPI11_04515 [Flavobacterium cerinum]
MKNIIATLLFFMAFSLSANAQEAKKDACCASKKTAGTDTKATTETASASTATTAIATGAKCDATAKGAKCDAKAANMTADAKTEAALPKSEADKKACKAKGSSCCASKAEAKKTS